MSKHGSAYGHSITDNKGRSCTNCEGHFVVGKFFKRHWCGASDEVRLYDYPHPSDICLEDGLYSPKKGGKATKYGDG